MYKLDVFKCLHPTFQTRSQLAIQIVSLQVPQRLIRQPNLHKKTRTQFSCNVACNMIQENCSTNHKEKNHHEYSCYISLCYNSQIQNANFQENFKEQNFPADTEILAVWFTGLHEHRCPILKLVSIGMGNSVSE